MSSFPESSPIVGKAIFDRSHGRLLETHWLGGPDVALLQAAQAMIATGATVDEFLQVTLRLDAPERTVVPGRAVSSAVAV
ncbi:MAG TPA: hypothetical protein EYP14_11990 [Planctomycetaceae bacterium]|nr:hypothetical protein [Planctomycetaceae bacterium]